MKKWMERLFGKRPDQKFDLDVWAQNSEKHGCPYCGSRNLKLETFRCDCEECYEFYQIFHLNQENATVTCKGCGATFDKKHFLSDINPKDKIVPWVARMGVMVDPF